MNIKFTHQGKEFEIRHVKINDEHRIRVFQNDKQVSPTYSISTKNEHDFQKQYGKSMIEELATTAQNDVIRGLYIS